MNVEYLLVLIILLALFVWDKFFYRKRTGWRQAPDLIDDADRAHRE